MSEPTKPAEKPAEKDVKPAPTVATEKKADKPTGYTAKYVRVSKVKELLVEGEGENAVNLRVSSDAKPIVAKYLDEAIAKAIKELIAKMPRKSKGDSKGELKRITIAPEDFTA